MSQLLNIDGVKKGSLGEIWNLHSMKNLNDILKRTMENIWEQENDEGRSLHLHEIPKSLN